MIEDTVYSVGKSYLIFEGKRPIPWCCDEKIVRYDDILNLNVNGRVPEKKKGKGKRG